MIYKCLQGQANYMLFSVSWTQRTLQPVCQDRPICHVWIWKMSRGGTVYRFELMFLIIYLQTPLLSTKGPLERHTVSCWRDITQDFINTKRALCELHKYKTSACYVRKQCHWSEIERLRIMNANSVIGGEKSASLSLSLAIFEKNKRNSRERDIIHILTYPPKSELYLEN